MRERPGTVTNFCTQAEKFTNKIKVKKHCLKNIDQIIADNDFINTVSVRIMFRVKNIYEGIK